MPFNEIPSASHNKLKSKMLECLCATSSKLEKCCDDDTANVMRNVVLYIEEFSYRTHIAVSVYVGSNAVI